LCRKLDATDILPALGCRGLLVRVRHLVHLLLATLVDLALRRLVGEEAACLSSYGGGRRPNTGLGLAFGLRWLGDGALVALGHPLGLDLCAGLIVLNLGPLLHLVLVKHLNEVHVLLFVI
jgi:hypothetical protein